MSEMVERVAAAIILAWYPDAPRQPPDGRIIVPPKVWDEAHHLAQAAITAMREPTPEMVEAARDVVVEGDAFDALSKSFRECTGRDLGPPRSISSPQAVTARWRTMIDHILSDGFTTGPIPPIKMRVAANPEDFKGIYGSKGS